METITLQYDASNPALRGLLAAFLKLDGVKKVKTAKAAKAVEPEYDPEFVKKIQRSRKSEGKKIALEDLWN